MEMLKTCPTHNKYNGDCAVCATIRLFSALSSVDKAQALVTSRAADVARHAMTMKIWAIAQGLYGFDAAPPRGSEGHKAVDAASKRIVYALVTRGHADVFAEGAPNANVGSFEKAEKAKARIATDGGMIKRGNIAADAGIKQPTARGSVEVPASTEATKTEVAAAAMPFASLLNELVARLTEVEKMDRDTLASVKRASATIYNTVAKEQEVRGYVKPAPAK